VEKRQEIGLETGIKRFIKALIITGEKIVGINGDSVVMTDSAVSTGGGTGGSNQQIEETVHVDEYKGEMALVEYHNPGVLHRQQRKLHTVPDVDDNLIRGGGFNDV
jgi:hypothetical protein